MWPDLCMAWLHPAWADVAGLLAALNAVQSWGQGSKDSDLKGSLLRASHTSSCPPWTVRGILGEQTLFRLWHEAVEGPVSCWTCPSALTPQPPAFRGLLRKRSPFAYAFNKTAAPSPQKIMQSDVSMPMCKRSTCCLLILEQAARSECVVIQHRRQESWHELEHGMHETLPGWRWDLIISQQPSLGRNLALKSNYYLQTELFYTCFRTWICQHKVLCVQLFLFTGRFGWTFFLIAMFKSKIARSWNRLNVLNFLHVLSEKKAC